MSFRNERISKNSILKRRKNPTKDDSGLRITKRRKLRFQERDVSEAFTTIESEENNVTQEQLKEDNQVVIDLSSSEDELEESPKNNSNPLELSYERICLFKDDLACLKGEEWLKDNVVDLALAELKLKHEKAGQAYLFNSLFFSKLRSIRDSDAEKKDYYGATKKWFKNGELSNKQFWVIPVCDQLHWYVIVVTSPRSNRPVITVMDSMRKKKYESVDLIKKFLKQKYTTEHKGKVKKINVHIADIPQQTNKSDCGLFAIRSASLFLEKKSTTYATLLENPQENAAELEKFYKDSPVPTRKMVLENIRSLVQNS